jgi:hypothetical protein
MITATKEAKKSRTFIPFNNYLEVFGSQHILDSTFITK